jgi:hypothetical protein
VCPSNLVFAHRLAVFPFRRYADLTLYQSSMHYHWAWQYSSTMRTDINYSPSDCVETFPFADQAHGAEAIGQQYDKHRKALMLSRREGLTKIYNRFHKPEETGADIRQMRDLHVELDAAVVKAYDWGDFDLGHDFHQIRQGVRFTISERARQEALARLLSLNHERYADEVHRGLHERTESRWSRDEEAEAAESFFTDEGQG